MIVFDHLFVVLLQHVCVQGRKYVYSWKLFCLLRSSKNSSKVMKDVQVVALEHFLY